MNRIFHPYWLWEDYKAGLYKLENDYSEQQEQELANKAKALLSNSQLFKATAQKVIAKWKYSAEVNLSNPSRNHQAWIGQASCCLMLGIPEYVTKYGWRLMTLEQQTEANCVADSVIKQWKEKQEANGYAKKIFEY